MIFQDKPLIAEKSSIAIMEVRTLIFPDKYTNYNWQLLVNHFIKVTVVRFFLEW